MKMKNIMLSVLMIVSLSGCSGSNTQKELVGDDNYVLVPLLTVEQPIESSLQDPNVIGLETEPIDVFDIDWQVKHESDQYTILYREVPDEMFFISIAYLIEDNCSCSISAKTRYQYIVYYNEKYYDIYEFHQKYNNLSCDFLEQIGIEYSFEIEE